MNLIDEIRRRNPSLASTSDDDLKSLLRQSPEFKGLRPQEFEVALGGTSAQPAAGTSGRNSETALGTVGDTIDAAQMGAYNVAQGLGDFAYEYAGIGRGLSNFGREGAARQIEEMSPRAAEAIQQQIFESTGSGLMDFKLGEGANPRTILLQTASLAGEALATGAGAGSLARGGISLSGRVVGGTARRRAAAQGLDEAGQQAAAQAAARDFAASRTADGIKLGTYGAGEMAINTGQIADGAYQEIMAMPGADLDESEAFAELYWEMADAEPDTSVDDLRQRAREKMATDAKSMVMRDPALLLTNAALGGYGGKVLDDLVTRGTRSSGRMGAAAGQAGVQGAVETGQGGMGQYSVNQAVAEVGADPGRNPMEGVAAAGLSEGVIGGLMGGGAGAAAGRPRTQEGIDPAREQTPFDSGAVQNDEASTAASFDASQQDLGHRIQIAKTGLADMAGASRNTFEGQTRFRNLQRLLDESEAHYGAGEFEQAGLKLDRAAAIDSGLRDNLQRSGSRENPMQGELADPEAPEQIAGLLQGRQGQLPPGTGDSIRGESPQQFDARQRARQEQADMLGRRSLGRDDVIYGEGPTRDLDAEQHRRRAAFEQQYGTAQNTGLDGEYMGPDALPGRPRRQSETLDGELDQRTGQLGQNTAPRLEQNGTIYGEGPVAGNANTGMDQPFAADPRFTPTRAEPSSKPVREAAVETPATTRPAQSAQGVATPRRVDVGAIQVDPEAYQFRADVNREGVDDRLAGVERWDDIRAGNLILHERLDGSLYAADGHHRVDLARRLQQPDVNAMVLREADGVSVADARAVAAEANIAAGNANALDAARVFRNVDGDPAQIMAERNLPNSQVVRDGEALARLDDEVFGAVLNRVVDEKDGAVIGRAFPDAESQRAALPVFQRVQPQNEAQRQILANEIRQAGMADGQREQMGMFGDDPAQSLIAERVRVLDNLRQRLARDRRLFATLNDNAQVAERAGNRINREQNDAQRNASAQAIDLIERAATMPEINRHINNAARRLHDGETMAAATRELHEALRNGTLPAAENSTTSSTPGLRPDDSAGQVAARGREVPERDNARGARESQQPVAGATRAQLKADGQPFQTRRAVELSKRFRDTPNARPIEVEGGWGFTTTRAQDASSFGLETQTEESLVQRANDIQQAEQADAVQQRQVSQRAAADREADDFNLTGSDRQADVAAAQGQQDLTEASTPEPPASDSTDDKANRSEQRQVRSERIEDFGEKIDGARKDQVNQVLAGLKSEVTDATTLGEAFPAPNYAKLLEEGIDPRAAALVAVLRGQVPSKPRKAFRLKQWQQGVRSAQQVASQVLDGTLPIDDLMQRARSRDNRQIEGALRTAELIAPLKPSIYAKAAKWSVDARSGYSIFNGEEVSPNTTFYRLRDERGRDTGIWATDFADMREQAANVITRAVEGDKGKPKSKRTPVNVYRDTSSGERFIAFKAGSRVIRLQSGFETVAAATDYLNENADAIQKQIDDLRAGPRMRRESNAPRDGVSLRDGDVTPESFQEAFGFRGVQFGNYVEGARRQADLNRAYDALMDLATILGLPPGAMSLDGTLGLAFGARGKGGRNAAAAHYEPGQVVINLTKTEGAGSLAHEWFHALDNFIPHGQGTSTYQSNLTTDGAARTELAERWREMRKALRESGFEKRSAQFDAPRSKPYFGKPIEMAARAFERYTLEKLESQGIRNDYLVNISDDADGPYPTAKEMQSLAPAFDRLMGTLEHRNTPQGIQLYALNPGSEATRPAPRAEDIREAIASTPELSGVNVIQTTAELPPTSLLGMMLQGVNPADVRGLFVGDDLYVIADNVDSVQEGVSTAVHEAVGHKGMRAVLGADLEQVMLNLYRNLPNSKEGREALREVQRDYPFLDPSKREDRVTIGEEMVAHLLEKGRRPMAWQRAVAKIRELLRQLFPSVAWTYTDALSLGEQSRAWLSKRTHEEAVSQARGGRGDENALSVEQARSSVASFFKRYPGADNVRTEIHSRAADVPGYNAQRDAGAVIAGQYHSRTDTLHIVAGAHSSAAQLYATLREEILVHKGLGFFASDDRQQLYRDIRQAVDESRDVADVWDRIVSDYQAVADSVNLNQEQRDRFYAEELLGELAQRWHGARPGWSRIVRGVKRLMVSAGWMPKNIGRVELEGRIELIADAFARGRRAPRRDFAADVRGRESQPNAERQDSSMRYALRAQQRTPFESLFDDFTDADRAAAAKIGSRTPPQRAAQWFKEVADRAGLKIRQGMVDRYAALKEMDERLYGESALGENIQRSSWVLARMSNAANGALHAMLHNGRIALNAKERVIEMQDSEAKGLGEVLGRLGSAAEIERFMGWIAGNRAARLAEDGRENLFDVENIGAMKTWDRGQTEDGRNRAQVYQEVFTEFQQYRDDVLAVAEQSGIITSDQREMWGEEFYVPFYRLSEEKGAPTGQMATSGLSRQQAYKRLKGGTQNLNDLLQNTMMNFHHLLDASLKNQASSQAIENAKRLGMAQRVPESNRDTKRSTFVMENGQKAFYEIDDPLVFTALTALAHPGMNSVAMKVMRGFKRVFTNLTTTTPQFMVANLIRDSLQASATSDVSKNAFKNVIGGGMAYRDARVRAQMMASGASFHFGHLYGNNPDELRAQLTRNMRDAKIVAGPTMVPNLLRAGWAKWNDLNNVTENLNRAAIYQQNQDKGGLRAAFESRDLIDFSAHGAWPAVRILIDIVPFLNARIQGLDTIYRSGMKPGASVLAEAFGKGKASVTDKQAAARFWTVTGAVTAATIALYLHNQNDEEYQKLEEWQKDTYWFFRVGNQAFFIPKPFEVGAIATQAERITEQFTDDKATGALFRQRLMHMMTDTFSFSPVPQMMQPALDIYANYDAFTGRPIEGMGMDRLSPELRRRSNTSKAGEWISAGLNKTLGAIGNPDQNPFALSPVQVDHLIGGYLGQVGTWAASSGDIAWRVATGEENPARRWYEYQPVRRFYRNLGDEDRYTKYGTIFYEGLREANRAYADAKELREIGRLADASELATSKRELLALRQPLNRAQRRLSTINQRIDLVRRSNLDAEVKRQRIDRLSAVKNQIQRALGERLQVMKAG